MVSHTDSGQLHTEVRVKVQLDVAVPVAGSCELGQRNEAIAGIEDMADYLRNSTSVGTAAAVAASASAAAVPVSSAGWQSLVVKTTMRGPSASSARVVEIQSVACTGHVKQRDRSRADKMRAFVDC